MKLSCKKHNLFPDAVLFYSGHRPRSCRFGKLEVSCYTELFPLRRNPHLQPNSHPPKHPRVWLCYFQESERSIVKGDVPLDEGHYALRQARIVLKRVEGCEDSPEAAADKESPAADEESPAADEGVGQSEKADSKVAEPADAVAEESETLKTTALADHASDKGGMPWREYPEIILFWGRNRRSGGQLVVCPYKSMDRLIEAYMVCEVVENTNKINR